MTIPVLVLATLVGSAIVVSVVYLFLLRYRRWTNALLHRIEALEAHIECTPDLSVLATSAVSEIDSAQEVSGDVLRGRTSFVRRVITDGKDGAQTLAERAIVIIHHNLDQRIPSQELADHLFVSIRSLQRGLAASLGCSPKQLVLAMKMREARRLLLSGSNPSITSVAFRLGFTTSSHFSTTFKAFFGVVPSQLVKATKRGL